jgi:hypothetical protein
MQPTPARDFNNRRLEDVLRQLSQRKYSKLPPCPHLSTSNHIRENIFLSHL